MQDKKSSKSNAARSEAMRAALLDASRTLFVEVGFVETSTPAIVQKAGVTRGALYHHFKDKADLFRAVVEREAVAVAKAIDANSPRQDDPVNMLLAGADAYFDAMKVPGRLRLLLLDGPSVLGTAEMKRIFVANDVAQLKMGLELALGDEEVSFAALADVVAAGFDRAAVAISEGGSEAEYRAAVKWLLSVFVKNSD